MKRNTFIKSLLALPFLLTQLSFKKKEVTERVFFTPEMLSGHNFGLFIIKNTSPKGSTNLSFAATVVYKLGYTNHSKFGRYGIISCLTDGWFCPISDDVQGLCDFLNNHCEPGYRLLTKEEYINIIQNRQQGFL